MVGRSAQVARGLNTIAARISTNTELLGTYGIQVQDTNGNLKSTYDVLKELKPVWDNLNDAERVALGNELAGINQYKVLASVLQNFQTALDATTVAYNSAGSAAKENSRYMESLEAQTNQLKATFQDFSNTVIDNELVSVALGALNTLLQGLNNEAGATITQWTLLTGVLTGGITIFGQIAGKLVNGIIKIGASLKVLGSAFTASGVSIGAFASAALPVAAILSGIAIAAWNIYKALDKADEKLSENKTRLEEINALSWKDITPAIVAEKNAIEEENKKLERQVKLKQTLSNLFSSGEDGEGFGSPATNLSGMGHGAIQGVGFYQTAAEGYDLVAKKLHILNIAARKNGGLSKEQAIEYANLVNEIEPYIEDIEELGVDSADVSQEARNMYANYKYLEEILEELNPKHKRFIENLQTEATQAGLTGEALRDYVIDGIINASETELDTSQQIMALKMLAEEAGVTAGILGSLFSKEALQNYIDTGGTQAGFYEMLRRQIKGGTGNNNPVVSETTNTGTGTDKRLEALKSTVALRKQELSFLEASGASEDTILAKRKDIQSALHDQAQYMRSVKADEADVLALSTEWWNIQNDINEAMDDTQDKINAIQGEIDKLNETLSKLENTQSDMEGVISYYVTYAEKQINGLDEQINTINDKISEINNKYDAQLEEVEDRYNNQLEALEAQNDAVEDQIELQTLLNNLEKAKKTQKMVYRDGAFVYQTDEAAVSQAQAELDTYWRNKNLEDQKQYIKDSLKAEQERIEKARELELRYKNNKLQALNDEKARWEQYRDGWSSVTSDYIDEQNRLLAEQMYGADQEKDNWNERLSNLQDFVSEYASLMGEIADTQAQINDLEGQKEDIETGQGRYEYQYAGSGSVHGESSAGEVYPIGSAAGQDLVRTMQTGSVTTGGDGSTWRALANGDISISKNGKEYIVPRSVVSSYASGTDYATGGLSLVGEQGPEMRVLNKGDGVIPANMTRNLMNWASITPQSLLSSLGGGSSGGGVSYSFAIDTLSLPNARSAEDLLSGLRNMALQYSYKRA